MRIIRLRIVDYGLWIIGLRIVYCGIKIRAMPDRPTSPNPQSTICNPQSNDPQSNDPQSRRAIFIDRDGTLNEDIGYVSSPNQLMLYPWAAEAVRLINNSGRKAIVITNQSGIARGMYTEDALARIHSRMIKELAREGARIDAVYYCPHHPAVGEPPYRCACECRKPRTGMLDDASREHNIDLTRSFVIGDKASDMELAENAGARGALVRTGYGSETLAHPDRWPCAPAIIAENLLEAVKQILDSEAVQS
jgi:D-glycero-D-manno-heptose 1,7-bisphosphate phosphatase